MPARTSSPWRMPSVSGSPTGRTPQDRSRVPQHRSGVTARSVPPTESVPDQRPVCASRWVSKTTLPLLRMYWRGSAIAGTWPSQVTSMATECSVGSTTTRRRRRGSRTSTRNGPTERSPRSTQWRRGADDVLGSAVAHVDERVDDAQVRVLPVAEDGEPLARGRVHVEVVPVVEVAVARRRVRDEFRRLMDRVVVREEESVMPVRSAAGAAAAAAAGHRARRTRPPAGSAARPVVAKTGKSRSAPTCPSGQAAGASASAIGRRSSKTA